MTTDPPPAPRAALGVIFFTILINMIGFGIVIPVLPFYARRFGANEWETGWLFGIFSLLQFVASPLMGILSDRFGRRPLLIVSALGTAAGFLIMGAAGSLAMLFAGRIIDGLSGGVVGTAQAYVADITSPENRSRAMGILGAAFGMGFVFGPALGGVLAAFFGESAPLFVAGALALANAILIAVFLPESKSKAAPAANEESFFQGLARHVRPRAYFTILATYFILIAGFSIMTGVFALFLARRHDFDATRTAYLFAMLGVIGAVVQGGLIGRLVKTFGEARLALAGSVILTASLAATPFASDLPGLLAACAGIALGNSLLSPTLTGLASRNVDADWQGRALGFLQSAGSLGRWLGPVAGGYLLQLDAAGFSGLYGQTPFLAAAGLMALTIFLCASLGGGRPAAR